MSRRPPGWFWGIVGTLSYAGASCDPQELRLFEPPESVDPNAGVSQPGVTDERGGDAGADVDVEQRQDAAPMTPVSPTAIVQPPCDPSSTACRACVAAGTCNIPEVCHPVSGNCVVACLADSPACPLATPFCNPTYGVCVWCLSDDECSGISPACNAASGTCVQCLNDDHCALLDDPALTQCEVAAQACRECTEDADCAGGSTCEVDEGHCEDSSDN